MLARARVVAIVLTMGAVAGSGAHQQAGAPAAALNGVPVFEVDPKWPVLPPDWTWGQVIGIFADSRGHVWTSSRSRISEWDPQGKLLQSWDARGPNGNWSTIHGLFVDHNGFVWTNARESHLTVKFTRTGQVAMVIGKYNETGGSNDTTLMGRPSEIWVDPADNEVFVADGYGNRRIIVFDGATGRYLRHWGAYGKRPEDPPAPAPGAPGSGCPTAAAQPPQQPRHRRSSGFRTASSARATGSSTWPTAPTIASRCSGRTASSCASGSSGRSAAPRRTRHGRRSGRAGSKRPSRSACRTMRRRPICTWPTAAPTSSPCSGAAISRW